MVVPCCGIGAYDSALQYRVEQAKSFIAKFGSRTDALRYLDSWIGDISAEAGDYSWTIADQIRAEDVLRAYIDDLYPVLDDRVQDIPQAPVKAAEWTASPVPGQTQTGPQFPGQKTEEPRVLSPSEVFLTPTPFWKKPLFWVGAAGAAAVAGVVLWAVFGRPRRPVPTYTY